MSRFILPARFSLTNRQLAWCAGVLGLVCLILLVSIPVGIVVLYRSQENHHSETSAQNVQLLDASATHGADIKNEAQLLVAVTQAAVIELEYVADLDAAVHSVCNHVGASCNITIDALLPKLIAAEKDEGKAIAKAEKSMPKGAVKAAENKAHAKG